MDMKAPQKSIAPVCTEDTPYYLALSQVPEVGSITLRKALNHVDSPKDLWDAPKSLLKEHLTQKKIDAFHTFRQKTDPHALLAPYQRLGIHLFTPDHDQYPPMLSQIYDAPLLLYVRGNPEALVGKTLAFVGTRRISDYGHQVVNKLVADLAPAGVTIISGLATGVDASAHRAALAHHLPTVAVFGAGIDTIYPSAHEKLALQILDQGGALISEYPLGYPQDKFTFPRRNRIMAGLSYGVVVAEGNVKSGSLITARLAMEENRAVYAVPGNIFSPGSKGTHHLIQTGATAITEGQDILKDLSWSLPSDTETQHTLFTGSSLKAKPATVALDHLSTEEREVLNVIQYDPTPIELIQERCGLPADKVNQALTMLELYGLLTPHAGPKFSRLS
ncbi:MAG: DNA-processing protein DprA [Vampirovibrio sp.]|nr:DNA-processing protein DprA [Vampirovibrio sp.]